MCELSLETTIEILQDCIAFEILYEIEKRVTNLEVKHYISMMMKNIAPVFMYELSRTLDKNNVLGLNKFFTSNDMKKRVQSERSKVMKYVISKSSKKEEIEKAMGISFDKKVYDLTIVLEDVSLISVNYETFIDNPNEEREFGDELMMLPRQVADAILSTICQVYSILFNRELSMSTKTIVKLKSVQLDEIANRISNEFQLKRYSYSTNKLFSKNPSLTLQDKEFILYRYRIIAAYKFIDRYIPNINISMPNIFEINTRKSKVKYLATIIEILGIELKELDTEFIKSIKAEIDTVIEDKDFFSLNRKLRNNAHYAVIGVIPSDKFEMIEDNQKKYFEVLLRNIDESLQIDIDDECINMTRFLKNMV